MNKDETLKLALETLEYAGPSWIDARQPAITAIKEALAQPEQEPVAWLNKEKNTIIWDKIYPDMQPLYTTPPQRTWVGLTRTELIRCGVLPFGMSYQLYEAIDQALKDKNT